MPGLLYSVVNPTRLGYRKLCSVYRNRFFTKVQSPIIQNQVPENGSPRRRELERVSIMEAVIDKRRHQRGVA